ncbi:MAG: hypothetical protein PVH19_00130 [Planctomycetia bacterium]|jgi:hypothetical protein
MITEHDHDHPGEENTWNVLKNKLVQVLQLADAVVDQMHEDTKLQPGASGEQYEQDNDKYQNFKTETS